MSNMKESFSIVVPVLNAKQYLRDCLNSILAAAERYPNCELIVLDNGSQDGSYELLLEEYSTRAQVQQIPGIPVSALRNRGAALAKGEYLAFVDSDCTIGEDYFEQANKLLKSGTDVTGSKCGLPDHPHWVEEAWHRIHADERDGPVKYINSGNLVVRREAFIKVGGFDETMISSEDADLGVRLNLAGFRIYQAQAVRATHLNGDKGLGTFFRKSAWRSMGMFGMFRNDWFSKPVFMNAAYLLLWIAAIALLFSHIKPVLIFALFLFLVNLAPGFSVGYYAWRVKCKSPVILLKALLLYHVYFLARFYVTWKVVGSWLGLSQGIVAFSARLHSSGRVPMSRPDSKGNTLSTPASAAESAATGLRDRH